MALLMSAWRRWTIGWRDWLKKIAVDEAAQGGFQKGRPGGFAHDLFLCLEKSGSSGTALKYVRRIQRRCEEIGIAPLAHVERPDIWTGLRMAVFERRIVILYVV
ncbi:hypothetical protein [Pararhizobium sp. DWP1-1-3]|uniref:hypothetical protein n=1 Tax=Pararhizobium sp. DWP1-1-3 TaxID=2804652 RepID=UPI003CF4618B